MTPGIVNALLLASLLLIVASLRLAVRISRADDRRNRALEPDED